jgi:D-glycero-D-manno-heptose 1,7-bisphosphate phosphatase
MKIVILDRDGTLNELGDAYITVPEEWVARPGALEAVARINRAGWNVVVATNQPGLGRGMLDVTALNAIHAKMLRQLAALGARVDAVFYCPHVPDDACHCRKPAPGLLEQIAERYGVEPHEVRVVGNTAQLDPGAPLPAEMPAGTQAHADLHAFADTLEAAGPGEAPRP